MAKTHIRRFRYVIESSPAAAVYKKAMTRMTESEAQATRCAYPELVIRLARAGETEYDVVLDELKKEATSGGIKTGQTFRG